MSILAGADGLDPLSFVSASQEAEDFVRIWNSAYETVMHETRQPELARLSADHAWKTFRYGSQSTSTPLEKLREAGLVGE